MECLWSKRSTEKSKCRTQGTYTYVLLLQSGALRGIGSPPPSQAISEKKASVSLLEESEAQ